MDPDIVSSSDDPSTTSATSARKRLERTFVFLYPWLNTAWEVVSLGWNVRYLFERTEVWDLSGWVVLGGRVRVGRLMGEDMPVRSSPIYPTRYTYSLPAAHTELIDLAQLVTN